MGEFDEIHQDCLKPNAFNFDLSLDWEPEKIVKLF